MDYCEYCKNAMFWCGSLPNYTMYYSQFYLSLSSFIKSSCTCTPCILMVCLPLWRSENSLPPCSLMSIPSSAGLQSLCQMERAPSSTMLMGSDGFQIFLWWSCTFHIVCVIIIAVDRQSSCDSCLLRITFMQVHLKWRLNFIRISFHFVTTASIVTTIEYYGALMVVSNHISSFLFSHHVLLL